MQGEVPLVYRDAYEQAKEFIENVSDYIPANKDNKVFDNKNQKQFSQNQKQFNKRPDPLEQMKRILGDQKLRGKEFCLDYNLKGEKGESKCKDRNCRKAHNCVFVPRGEKVACGRSHPKFDHRF